MYHNTNKNLIKSQNFYTGMKEERGDNQRIEPLAGSSGHLMGTPDGSKGCDRKMLVKHDGIVMGGSVTAKKPTTSAKSINKMPREGRNIVGND
jgi:hypothetical protein